MGELVLTSPCERASERASVRTDSGGGGGESQGNPNGGAQECHLFLAGNHTYVILRFWAARGFLVGNSMKIACINHFERDRSFFLVKPLFPKTEVFHLRKENSFLLLCPSTNDSRVHITFSRHAGFNLSRM